MGSDLAVSPPGTSTSDTTLSQIITDRVANGEVSIEYCPTGDMVGDFHTKSLQGSQFCRFRDIILGIEKSDIAAYNTRARQYLKTRKEKQHEELLGVCWNLN